MTTYQFRAAHLLPTRGVLRRGDGNFGNSWSVVGAWRANDLEASNAHHHSRKKKLVAYTAGCSTAERKENIDYSTEKHVYDAVLRGKSHPVDRVKKELQTHWSDGIGRDGRGVSGGWGANQHPDVETRSVHWQESQAADRTAQLHKEQLSPRGRQWLDLQAPPEDIKKELEDQMFMKLPSFMSRQPRARNDLMPGFKDTKDFQLHVNHAGSLGWDFKDQNWACGPPAKFAHPPPPPASRSTAEAAQCERHATRSSCKPSPTTARRAARVVRPRARRPRWCTSAPRGLRCRPRGRSPRSTIRFFSAVTASLAP